jgi:hypothetical protein
VVAAAVAGLDETPILQIRLLPAAVVLVGVSLLHQQALPLAQTEQLTKAAEAAAAVTPQHRLAWLAAMVLFPAEAVVAVLHPITASTQALAATAAMAM